MNALDTPGRLRATVGFLTDMERELLPFDAFGSAQDQDAAGTLDIFSAQSATTQGDN